MAQECPELEALVRALNLDKLDLGPLEEGVYVAKDEQGYLVQIECDSFGHATLEEAMRQLIQYAKERRTI